MSLSETECCPEGLDYPEDHDCLLCYPEALDTPDSDGALRHASRQPTHAFRDLRSARPAKNHTSKHIRRYKNFQAVHPIDLPPHPQQPRHLKPVREEKHDHFPTFPADISELTPQRFTAREAYIEAQQGILPFRKHHSREGKFVGKRLNRHSNAYSVKREAREFDAEEEKWHETWQGMQCCSYCQCHNPRHSQGTVEQQETARTVNSWDEWTEVGEPFGQWAQRRIAEMRIIKEKRLRMAMATAPASAHSNPTCKAAADDDDDEGYHSSSPNAASTDLHAMPTTALTSHPDDMYAESILKCMLTTTPRLRRRGPPMILPGLRRFFWFSGPQVYWHRNESGCWELKTWGCADVEGGRCKGCNMFRGLEWWDAEARSQKWMLDAWISDEDWEAMQMKDSAWRGRSGIEDGEDEDLNVKREESRSAADEDEEWDMLSMTASASSSWTEVDVDLDTQP